MCFGIFILFCRLLIFFFKINFLEKIFQEYRQSFKQIGSRSGATFCRGLIWVQTFCECYQQTTLVAKELTCYIRSYSVRGSYRGYNIGTIYPVPKNEAKIISSFYRHGNATLTIPSSITTLKENSQERELWSYEYNCNNR